LGTRALPGWFTCMAPALQDCFVLTRRSPQPEARVGADSVAISGQTAYGAA